MEVFEEEFTEDVIIKPGFDIILLPRTLIGDKKNTYNSTSSAVMKLLSQNGIKTNLYTDGEVQFQEDRSFEWFGPVIFVSALTLSQNPNLISIALGIISNYLTDIFKGSTGDNKVSLTIIRENSDNTKTKIKYKGDKDGLKELDKIVRASK